MKKKKAKSEFVDQNASKCWLNDGSDQQNLRIDQLQMMEPVLNTGRSIKNRARNKPCGTTCRFPVRLSKNGARMI